MPIKYIRRSDSTEKPKPSGEDSKPEIKAKTNEELNEENPARRKRRQATEEELNDPLHGVKLAQILDDLVDYYGWEYLAERVNIRCFKYNPTKKSSLRFLRRMPWARAHVEDLYLEMLKEV
ncbi:MAG: VF530 family protein [Vicingaceae bacterium]